MIANRGFLFGVVAALLSGLVRAESPSAYIEQLTCEGGPYRITLPWSYAEVRKLGPLIKEEVLRTYNWDDYKTQDRSLIFQGLELVVVTFSNEPDKYMLSSAKLTGPQWRITGKLRVGNTAAFALRGIPFKSVPRNGNVSLGGDTDSIGIKLSNGRITEVYYACYTG